MAATTDELTYQCPHCKSNVRVASAMMGELVDCPECNRQFQAEAPIARPSSDEFGRGSSARKTVEQHADDERVLREVHPAVFRSHILLTLLMILAGIGGIAAILMQLAGAALFGLEGVTLLILGSVLLAAGLVYFLFRWVQAMSTTLRVTTERTIAIRGLISKSTNEVQHDDVRNIKSERNLWERMFNYGDIALSSSGQDDMEIMVYDIPDPEGIIKIIRTHQ